MEQLEEIKKRLFDEHENLSNKYIELEKKKSTEKNKTKKIQDNILKKIELKKLETRMKILTLVIQELNTNISLYKIGYNKLNTLLQNQQIINDEILTFLENEYKELDILSTKKVLAGEFETERLKGIKKYDFGPFPLFGGVSCAWAIGIPLLRFINPTFSLLNMLLPVFLTGTCGVIGTCYFMARSTKRKIKVFNNLNKQLGEKAIAIEINEAYKEHLMLERLINKKINSMVTTILMNIKEFQCLIEGYNKENNKQVSNNSNKKFNIINTKESIDVDTLNYDNKKTQQYIPVTVKKVLVLKRKQD